MEVESKQQYVKCLYLFQEGEVTDNNFEIIKKTYFSMLAKNLKRTSRKTVRMLNF